MKKLPFPISLWPVPEIPPENPGIIVPLDYGVDRKHRNANATNRSLEQAALLWRQNYPRAKIVFGTSSHCFPGSDKVSTEEKKMILQNLWVSEKDFIYTGPITNSVTEAKAAMYQLFGGNMVPAEMLLICDRLHSRDVLLIWQYLFPTVKISLLYTTVDAWQEDHIFPSMWTMGAWFMANVKRHAALKVMDVDWVGKHGIHKAD